MVASRPGYSLADVANALPASLRPQAEATRPFQKQAATWRLGAEGVTVHLLEEVYQPISSTTIRQAAAAGKPLGRFVEPAVAEYIKKTGLYKTQLSTAMTSAVKHLPIYNDRGSRTTLHEKK